VRRGDIGPRIAHRPAGARGISPRAARGRGRLRAEALGEVGAHLRGRRRLELGQLALDAPRADALDLAAGFAVDRLQYGADRVRDGKLVIDTVIKAQTTG
jgi:hypothetical protein